MKLLLEKILSHPLNEKVLKFLDIRKEGSHTLTPIEKKNFFTHEGLEDFLQFDVPAETIFILDNKGVIIISETGEIIAFHFNRTDSAFKIQNPELYKSRFYHLKSALRWRFHWKSASKVSLGYFSNVFNDADTILDIRELGNNWALSIYFPDDKEKVIQEYYYLCIS